MDAAAGMASEDRGAVAPGFTMASIRRPECCVRSAGLGFMLPLASIGNAMSAIPVFRPGFLRHRFFP